MLKAAGWILQLIGLAVWLFGYFIGGHANLINWNAFAPWWIANFLPNIESEIGIALMLVSLVPMYWPQRTPLDRQ